MNFRLLILLCLFFMSAPVLAQTDVTSPNAQIPIEEQENAETDNVVEPNPLNEPLEIPDFKPEKGEEETLDLPINSSVIELDYERKKGFSMTEKSTLIDPAVIWDKKWEEKNKQIALADRAGNFRKNINFGSFNTGAAKVEIVYRDHQVFDGDRIRVLVNDDIVRSNVLLHTGFSGFNLNLLPGINKIDFLALNQGDSGPNTAYLAVYDEDGTLISANEWNLATGFKATIIVVKQKE